MAFSTDTDLTAISPDILSLGIASFADEHAKAEADIKRELRAKWWPYTGYSGEMDDTLLINEAQFTRCNAYLVLWKYALPKLTNWVDGDRFREMQAFYKDLYNQELQAILDDGVQYDRDGDGLVSQAEKIQNIAGRLTR